MKKERKEIVVNEIKYWKKNKLLPEQYCNFLLTLYTEGDEQGTSKSFRFDKQFILPFIMVQVLFLSATLIFYFTDIPIIMQIVIGILFTIAIWYIAKKTKSFSRFLASLYLLMGVFLLYFLTLQVGVWTEAENGLYISVATVIHGLLWLTIGWFLKIRLFLIIGILGIVIAVYLAF
ncbi:hypothetical protein [Bacillus suaedae]|uniref:Uncharacterized protein n=1 Tax=Halalkalibacter suaedae TaxID=2822140 RepID=A0A941APA5_9BACI|nr:hypothetical protein [Bacillus suaedae]MBP3951282.1 hypothetical protein [Bacillus suaedae]